MWTRLQRGGLAANGVPMMAAAAKTWRRLARRFGGDGNPLRRWSDVMEGWLVPVAVALFVALCPVAVALTGLWVGSHNAAAQRAQAAAHPVRAILLDSAAGPQYQDHGANTWVVWTPARWSANGHTQTGAVPAEAGMHAGSTMTVWVDRAGRIVHDTFNATRELRRCSHPAQCC